MDDATSPCRRCCLRRGSKVWQLAGYTVIEPNSHAEDDVRLSTAQRCEPPSRTRICKADIPHIYLKPTLASKETHRLHRVVRNGRAVHPEHLQRKIVVLSENT